MCEWLMNSWIWTLYGVTLFGFVVYYFYPLLEGLPGRGKRDSVILIVGMGGYLLLRGWQHLQCPATPL